MQDIKQVKQTGFSYEIRDDGIRVYRLNDMLRESVDEFIKTMGHYEWTSYEAGRHNRVMMDISMISVPTPYIAKRVQESIEAMPADLRESFALVTPNSMIYTLTRVVLNRLPQKLTSHVRFFRTEQEAMVWLDERLEELGP